MNSVSVKYKSLFYSLSIHALLVVVFVLAYMKTDKSHEVHSLVNLTSMHFSSPAVETMPQPIAKKPKVQKAQKLPSKVQVKKTETVAKTAKVEPVKTVEVAKLTPVVKEEPKPLEKREEVQEQIMAVNTQSTTEQEELAQTVVTAKPTVNYEAQYMQDNIALINALIRKNLFYPRLAKKRGLEGKTMVSFTLNEEGEVVSIKAMGIIASILKKSAIETVEKASSSFPHPKVTLALRIPIVYKLN